MTPAKATLIIAQARFLRAFFHFELKKVFGNIVYADETVIADNTDVTNTVDVWPKIEADLQFAVANLPKHGQRCRKSQCMGCKSNAGKGLYV